MTNIIQKLPTAKEFRIHSFCIDWASLWAGVIGEDTDMKDMKNA